MWNFTRKRQTAGNICLVLFTAFLFTILVSPFAMVGSAEAAWQNQESPPVPVAADSAGTITESGAGYELLINLAVTDPLTDFNSIEIKFVDGNGSVISIYADDSNFTKTYQPDSAGSVYGSVYSLVYLTPAGFTLDADEKVYGYVYYGGNSLYDIILTLTSPPPSSGGGGSTTTTSTTSTTTNNTGTVTVNISTGTAINNVDTAKVLDLLNGNQDVVIEAVPTGTSVATVTVNLAASILTTASEMSKALTIKTDDVQFVIPPAALNVAALEELLKADPNTKVTLNVTEAKATIPNGNDNLQQVGKVFNFELVAKSTDGETKISTFTKALKVSIPYIVGDLNGVSEDKLGAYRITVNGLVFLGGQVDKDKKIVTFETESFSEYTLAVKIAAFADIVNHWAKSDIDLLAEKGIVKGVSASNFAPDASITRAEFATLLVKALGLTESNSGVTFGDVSSGAWYYANVKIAAANGLVKGFNGKFNPNGKITREEMAAMIANALKVGGKSETGDISMLNKFSDMQQISGWAQSSAAIAVKVGIINGRTADTFVPKANATRAEGTVMIKKVLQNLGKL